MSDSPTQESEVMQEVRRKRGYVLPLHEHLERVSPEILRRYDELHSFVVHGPVRALDLKTRYLLTVGIVTAVPFDEPGIEWAAKRAMQHGATIEEVEEAIAMAMLSIGVPAFEAKAVAWKRLREGGSYIGDGWTQSTGEDS